jgi:Tfp pilus assembly protein PilO
LGALRFAELSEKSHDAAWREAFERQTGDFEIRLDQMVETLPNAAQVRDYLENPHP